MVKIQYWVIRQKGTGFYFPAPTGRSGRGGAFTEPMDFENRTVQVCERPRLFHSTDAAKAFLGQWHLGKVYCSRSYDWEEDLTLKPVPGRDKTQMEIVPITIELPHVYETSEGTIHNGHPTNRSARRRTPPREQDPNPWI